MKKYIKPEIVKIEIASEAFLAGSGPLEGKPLHGDAWNFSVNEDETDEESEVY